MSRLQWLIAGALLLSTGCDDDEDPVVPGADAATETSFDVELTTEEEVPVCAAAGADATGAAVVMIAPDDSMVTVNMLTFTELSGPPTGAHIHAGAPGVAGPIVFDLGTDLTGLSNMVFTQDDYPDPAPMGAPPSYLSFVRMMEDGNSYLNVHTAACPAGEIRGQLD